MPESKEPATASLKILLVDDSEVILRHVGGLLARQGYSVVKASTSAAALEAIVRHRPGAVLVDFVLEAGQTGLQLIPALFAVAEKVGAPKPAAALLTMARLDDADTEAARQLGTRVLVKPRRGKETEFLQELAFWLREMKLQ